MAATLSMGDAPNVSSQASLISRDPSISGQAGNHMDQPVEPLLVFPIDNVPQAKTRSPSHLNDNVLTRVQSAPESGHAARPTLNQYDSLFDDHLDKRHPNEGMDDAHPPTGTGRARKRDILLAAAWVFLPILAISLLLLGFTFYGAVRITFPSDAMVNSIELPAKNPSTSYYYTSIKSAPFALVGSWASNIAVGLFTPFMLLFSFLVAWTATTQGSTETSHMMREILRGNQDDGLWKWTMHVTRNVFSCGRARNAGNRSLNIAGVGFLVAFIMSLLVISADNWLHITTITIPQLRVFNVTTYPLANGSNDALSNDAASYVLLDGCSSLSPNDLPCSLNSTDGITNVAYPDLTYLILNTGITQKTSEFNNLDFASLDENAAKESTSLDLIVNYTAPGTDTAHAFLFWGGAAEEVNSDDGPQNYGIDYVARTTSVSTTCSYATRACDLKPANSSSPDGRPITYNCSDFFQGDLNQIPAHGIERIVGWNTSFYEPNNGTPQSLSLQTPANPFRFFVATALESISYQDVQSRNPNDTANGDIIDARSGRIAYTLDCTASVYDVNYTLINGSITNFVTRLSDDNTATIVRAPLQSSFGTYTLFQKASTAIVSFDPLVPQVELALSQVAIAGSFGAFGYGVNIAQRERWDSTLTRISKPALLYFVVTCLLYAALGLCLLITAFVLRGRKRVRETQAILLPNLEHTRILPTDVVQGAGKGVQKVASFRSHEDDNRRNSSGSGGSGVAGFFGAISS